MVAGVMTAQRFCGSVDLISSPPTAQAYTIRQLQLRGSRSFASNLGSAVRHPGPATKAALWSIAFGIATGIASARRRRKLAGRTSRVDAAKAEDTGISHDSTSIARWGAWRVLLIVAYICNDTAVYLVSDWASKGYTPETVLFCSAFLTVLFGWLGSVLERGPARASRDVFGPRNVLRLLPVSAGFVTSMLLFLQAFRSYDGAFIKLLGQMKLPLTALLSYTFLGVRYSSVQWQIILMICVGCTTFTLIKLGDVQVGAVSYLGLAYVLGWALFNVVASLYGEKALKDREALPFPTIMANMRIGEMVAIALLLALHVQGFQLRRFFDGWDMSTIIVMITLVSDAWISATMVKRLSSVAKNISKCGSLVVLYALSVARGGRGLVPVQALSALLILQSTVLFVSVSMQAPSMEALRSEGSSGARPQVDLAAS